MTGNFEFQNPWVLCLLILIPFLIYLKFKKRKQNDAVKISSLKPFGNSGSFLSQIKPLLYFLRILTIGFIIVALARPQIVEMTSTVKSDKGIDILMVVDTSDEALKEVAENFALKRPTDRIGLVAYSGEAIAKVPLTTDHRVLINEIRNLQTGELEDGTAIGVGLATALNHLKDSKASSKVIILITDGVESVDYRNDLLYVTPQAATQIAVEKNIKV